MFKPTVTKHRLYTGDISNHIEITHHEVTKDFLGEATLIADVGFTGGETIYHFEIPLDNYDGHNLTKEEIAGFIAEDLQHRL